MSEGDKDRCICCGAEFVDGKGFVEPHTFPCANGQYGWAWTMKESERKTYGIYEQPHGLMQVAALRLVPHITGAPSPQSEQTPVKQSPGEHT